MRVLVEVLHVRVGRTPLPLAQVGSPFLPGNMRLARVVQPLLLGDIHNHRVHFLSFVYSLVKRELLDQFPSVITLAVILAHGAPGANRWHMYPSAANRPNLLPFRPVVDVQR